jgi:hypothetical protein
MQSGCRREFAQFFLTGYRLDLGAIAINLIPKIKSETPLRFALLNSGFIPFSNRINRLNCPQIQP